MLLLNTNKNHFWGPIAPLDLTLIDLEKSKSRSPRHLKAYNIIKESS